MITSGQEGVVDGRFGLLRRLLGAGAEFLDVRDHVDAVLAQKRDVSADRAAVAGYVSPHTGSPLTPSQQSSLSVSRTVLMRQRNIAETDAWSTGPSANPVLS